MSYRVEFHARAARVVRKLEADVRRRILDAATQLAEQPRPPGAITMQGAETPQLRIRIGDYRLIYEVHDHELVVLVVQVGHRRDVYRR